MQKVNCRAGAAALALCAFSIVPGVLAQSTFSLTPANPFVGSDYCCSLYDVKPGEADFHFGTVKGSVSMQGPSGVVGSADPSRQLLVLAQPATFIVQQTISGAESVSITVDANFGDTSCPQFGPCTFNSLSYFPLEQPPVVGITTTLTIIAGGRYSFNLNFYWNVAAGACPAGSSGSSIQARAAGAIGHAPTRPATASETDFVNDVGSGKTLSCLRKSQGPIEFDIDATRYVAPTRPDGQLGNIQFLIDNQVVSAMAQVKISAYTGAGAGCSPKHTVTLNGNLIGILNAAPDQWTENKINVPIGSSNGAGIRFPDIGTGPASYGPPSNMPSSSPPVPSHNHIRIDIDTQSPTDDACVAVDWGSISIGAAAPLMLIHGTHADHTTWDYKTPTMTPYTDYITQNIGVDFEYKSIDLLPGGDNNFENNARQLQTILEQEAKRRGVQSLHLIAHSKGASDSRYYLARLYKPGQPIRILSLFSLGTPSRGTPLSDWAVEVEKAFKAGFPAGQVANQDPLVSFSQDNAWAQLIGAAPVDPAREIQRLEPMRQYNNEIKPVPGIVYYSLAGNADQNGDKQLNFMEMEGLFPAAPTHVQLEANPIYAKLGNRIYQALGRTKSIKIIPIPGQYPWEADYGLVQGIFSSDPEPNDMVSTTSSVHCSECGFIPLSSDDHKDAIYPYNHTTIKSAETIRLIWERITSLFPLRTF
jgi:triacylglycerol esterase/lipase EstA (alpha/beta hydrolase family)